MYVIFRRVLAAVALTVFSDGALAQQPLQSPYRALAQSSMTIGKLNEQIGMLENQMLDLEADRDRLIGRLSDAEELVDLLEAIR